MLSDLPALHVKIFTCQVVLRVDCRAKDAFGDIAEASGVLQQIYLNSLNIDGRKSHREVRSAGCVVYIVPMTGRMLYEPRHNYARSLWG